MTRSLIAAAARTGRARPPTAVRASLGIGVEPADIDRLVAAAATIAAASA